VLPTTGLALTDSLEIVEETAAAPGHVRQAILDCLSRQAFVGDPAILLALLRTGRPSTESIPSLTGTVVPFCPRYPNYYHWMIETVPKLRYVEEYERVTDDNVTLLVPDDAPSFVDETLNLLGCPASKIERATASVYQVNDLLVPAFPEPRADDYRWIRDRVLDSSPSRATDPRDHNVYISRSNAIERRVVNEPEVVSMLREYDFESYKLEEQSLATNARLFAEADVVVAPHGAGLTDIIFAEDCAVVELFGSKVKQPYEYVAEALGLEYESLVCEAQSTDIVVDVETLEAIVRDLAVT
jgi:capsular polysaccharide biosynthesis protein